LAAGRAAWPVVLGAAWVVAWAGLALAALAHIAHAADVSGTRTAGAGQADPQLAKALQAAPLRVLAVLDGDTLDVQDRQGRRWRIRLQGIDAPELGHSWRRRGKVCHTVAQPHAEAARQALADQVQGQTVRLRTDGVRSYDRVVVYVLRDGREVNLALVAQGWAWSLDQHHTPASRRLSYAHAQREARVAGRGLWSDGGAGPGPIHPARWRATQGRC
jgi:endonuclease YncB( thermonuclease family)